MRSAVRTTFLIAFSTAALSQSASREEFDVASVKPTPTERLHHLRLDKCPGGGMFVTAGAPLVWTITYAYRVADTQLLGAPSWTNTFEDTYDIEGKAAQRITDAQCRSMVRSLLETRFRLATHREHKEAPVYALVVGKNGHKLHAVKPDDPESLVGVIVNGGRQQALSDQEVPAGWSMARLADYVSNWAGRPVIDKTGLPGDYSFHLDFSRHETEDRPSIFTALQGQLGLKLEPDKAMLEYVVIDHIERPSSN